jgi:hypothetical protein
MWDCCCRTCCCARNICCCCCINLCCCSMACLLATVASTPGRPAAPPGRCRRLCCVKLMVWDWETVYVSPGGAPDPDGAGAPCCWLKYIPCWAATDTSGFRSPLSCMCCPADTCGTRGHKGHNEKLQTEHGISEAACAFEPHSMGPATETNSQLLVMENVPNCDIQ